MVPEMQPPLVPGTVLHVCPCLLLQAPPESQVPAHRLGTGSSFPVTATQVPLLPQLWQVAQSLSAQHFALGMQALPHDL